MLVWYDTKGDFMPVELDFDLHNKTERAIVKLALTAILQAGFTVSVWEGEDYAIKKSRDKDAILKAMFSTEEDMLHIYTLRTAEQIQLLKENGSPVSQYKQIGFVHFIYGNNTDVIHDYSDTPVIHALLKSAQHYAERKAA